MPTEVEQIELAIEDAQKKVEIMNKMEKLKKNRLFKELFLEGYCKDYCHRMVANKVSLGMQEEKMQKYIDGQLLSIGHLQLYMGFIIQEGRVAEKALADHEEEVELAREEEV